MTFSSRNSHNKGFSIVELIVTISVFALLSTSLVGNYRSSTKALSLSSLAALVSSDIRRAQAYGISNISRDNLSAPYYFAHGISFQEDPPDNKSYIIFADVNGNFINNNLGACMGECVEKMAIVDGSYISALCVNTKKTGTCTAVDSLHISFKRPEPEPFIKGVIGGVPTSYDDAEITLKTRDGSLSKTIVVWKTGLVAVE
ncbi:MAG: type II secretion system protein [Candidatus Paceibacterota bacterium]|jgi:prepilin-type N-terminal cleavage/methylation domain-containing protein